MKIRPGRTICTQSLLSVWAVMSLIASGCAPKDVIPWTPKPRVAFFDIVVAPEDMTADEYRILLTQPTKGLFPAGIAVSRLSVETASESGAGEGLSVAPDPHNEFLRWNSAFDDLMAVSEVFPIVRRDLGGAEATAQQIITSSRALHARLGLIYAMNELSETEAEMIGALYETGSAQPIACFHARAISITPPEDAEDEIVNDLWRTDARALVRDKFERLVHACVRELILQDEPAERESTEGWIPPGPILPVEWPPRALRTGR